MASQPIIFGVSSKKSDDVLADVGTVLLQVKNARCLTLIDMASVIGRGDDMVAKYIAGENEMGMIAWNRALREWPELPERIDEVAAATLLTFRPQD